jgi:hypothetical protein
MLGRQTVRRAIQRVRSNQTPTDTDGVVNDSNPPEPLSVTSTRIEPPLAIDADAENAFVNNGTAWYFRRGRPIVNDAVESGMSTPAEAGYTNTTDPLRSPVLRRKWASDLLESRGSPDGDIPRSRDHFPPANDSAQSTFFGKIGRKSVSALSIPFSSTIRSSRVVRSREPSSDRHEPSWSSDSSSEEDTTSPYGLKPARAASLPSLVIDTQDDSDHGGPSEDVDSD